MTAAKATVIEWFLGRDGTQYGPLSDVEMRKLFELGHLRADDLVWRQGFSTWLPAPEVFKAPAAPATAAPPTSSTTGAAPAPAPASAPSQPAAVEQAGADRVAADSEAKPDVAPMREAGELAAAFEAVQSVPDEHPDGGGDALPAEALPGPGGMRGHGASMTGPAGPHQHVAGPAPAEPQPAAAPPPAQHPHDPSRPYAYTPVFEPAGPSRHETTAAPAARTEPAHRAGPTLGYGPGGHEPRPERGHAPAYGGHGPGGSDASGLPASPDDLIASTVQADGRRRRAKPAKAARTGNKSMRRIVATLVVTALLIGAGVGGYLYRDALADVAGRAGQQVAALIGRAQEPAGQRPAGVTSASREPSGLWQSVKTEFPEWYAERTREAAKIRVETKDERAAVRYLTESLVALRRSHADAALAASPDSIRKIASTFVANLDELKRASVEHCYTYISLGEANPKILELSDVKSATATIEAQIGAVFEAIAEGRRQPQTHLPPRKADYDMLADELVRRGWSDSDLQVFSDPRQLARAAPVRVCGMVRDWFAAHLAIQDPNVQLRLLIESLKPVVAG